MALGNLVLGAAQTAEDAFAAQQARSQGQRQFEDEQRISAATGALTDMAKQASTSAQQMIAAGKDPAQVAITLRDAFKPAVEDLRLSLSMGGIQDMVPFAQFESLFSAIARSPTPEDVAAGQARTEVAGQTAAAEAAAPVIGEEAARLQAFPGVATQAGLEMERGRLGVAQEQAAIDRQKVELDRLKILAGEQPKFTDVMSAQKEFSDLSKNFIATRDAYSRIQSTGDSAAGDLSMIFAFMRMLDPTSVVREGEQATAANAAGIPDRIRNTYNRLLTGERLTPEQRKDFRAQAKGLFAAAEAQQTKFAEQYKAFADRQGLPPEDVVLDFAPPGAAASTANTDIESMNADEIREFLAQPGLSDEVRARIAARLDQLGL